MRSDAAAAISLLSAQAVRSRADRMLALGLDGRLENFSVDLSAMDAVAERVMAVTHEAYPTLDIPFHSRWRHFAVNGVDRFEEIAQGARWPDRETRARSAFYVEMLSVFLDDGAGRKWR
jgi:hypothetical protein